MCGIFGYVGTPCDGALGLALLRRRGPDGLAYWSDEEAQVWLGHARLAIQDVSSAGDQPMHEPSARYTMIYDGEIYNSPEIRAELEARGERFAGHCDSEVLLRLFALEGPASFARLNGIFAAAFWDSHERTLTLVRDAMGVKPLYIDRRRGRFAFASEMKSLLRTNDVRPAINPAAVLHHLVYLWSPGEETIADGIFKLLPGHYIVRHADGSERQYVFANPSLPQRCKSQENAEGAALQVAQAIETAVERQLLSDVPVGAFLSGGLDSSSVVAFAARKLRDRGQNRMPCFSIELTGHSLEEEGIADDLPYARKVADHCGLDLHIVRVGTEMTARLAEVIYLLDEPNADPASLNSLLITERAQEIGIKVLLSGTGGDEVFAGHRRHFALQQEHYWAWLPRPARSMLRHVTGLLPKNSNAGRRLSKAFASADRELDERIIGYFQWIDPRVAQALMVGACGTTDASRLAQAPLRTSLSHVPDGASPLERMLYLERRHFLADHNLTYTDKSGMAASVEIRAPLLDPDLMACADSLPDSYRVNGRTVKWICKKAMEPHLPRDVIYRPKAGFGAPLRRWLSGPLRPLVDAVLSQEALHHRGLFQPKAVEALIAGTAKGRIDATYTIFAIICIELWCRQFIDGAFALDECIDPSALDMRRVA